MVREGRTHNARINPLKRMVHGVGVGLRPAMRRRKLLIL
jgi:hypothetical protein